MALKGDAEMAKFLLARSLLPPGATGGNLTRR